MSKNEFISPKMSKNEFNNLIKRAYHEVMTDKMFYEIQLIEMVNIAKFNNISTEIFCFMPFKYFSFFDRTPLKNLGHLIMLNAIK